MAPKLKEKCYACGEPANFTIMLALTGSRIYLPNQGVRSKPRSDEPIAFCVSCMRKIEDNLRATILYLQAESSASNASDRARQKQRAVT